MRRFSVVLSCTLAIVLGIGVTGVSAMSNYFNSFCAGCHQGKPTTCAGCHMHGTHSSIGARNINVTATTNKTSYAPGESIQVRATGGNLSGWVRVVLYDQSGVEVARSSGPCNDPSAPDNGCGGGNPFPGPIVLSATAPATPGTYRFSASWYGNQRDGSNAFFGPNWRPDPNNPDHGEEIVSTNSFTVAAQTGCYGLTLSHTGQGSNPTASPANSTGCPAGQYAAGEVIALTATPAAGGSVRSWTGTDNDTSTALTNTVTMPASSHAASVAYAAACGALGTSPTAGGFLPFALVAGALCSMRAQRRSKLAKQA